MGRLLSTLKHEQPMFIWYTNSAIVPNFNNIFYCDSLELIIVDQI
jgi:hypothetical protein